MPVAHTTNQKKSAMYKSSKILLKYTLFEIAPNVDPAISATMMQSNATTITAYEDAGAKFRDRTSRIEALRMYSTAVRSILMTPI